MESLASIFTQKDTGATLNKASNATKPSDLGGLGTDLTTTMSGGTITGGAGGVEGTGRVVGTQTGQVPIQLAGGEAGPAESWGLFSDRSPIHIAPVGVNLGAILAPYQEGSPENGGYGLELMSRFMDMTKGSASEEISVMQGKTPSSTYFALAIAGVGILGLIIILWR